MAIARRFNEKGWAVAATCGGPVPTTVGTEGISWSPIDRDHVGDLRPVVPAGTDVVVDVRPFTPAHADQLIAMGDRVGSAIVLSTLSVYSDREGRSLDQATDEAAFPQWPVPIPEDWPTLAPADTGYSSRKVAIEQALRDRAPWPVTILRPGAIHGPHSRHLREWYFIKRCLDRRAQVVLPYHGESIFQPTATVNLAELVTLAAEKPAPRTLNCADLEPPTAAEISATIDELMNCRTERVLVGGPEPGPTVGNHPWAVPRPVVADMSRAQKDLGYLQRASYAEAMAATVEWALAACAGRDWREVMPTLAGYPGDLFDYEAEDTYLKTFG